MTMIEDTLYTHQSLRGGLFERPTALRAVRRFWYLVLLCALLGAGTGAFYAFKRPPIYTASSRLAALSVNNSNAASLAGSLQAAQELASTFARVVESSQVTQAVAASLNTTPAWVTQHLNGTPIPSSPFVRIDANASSPGVAMQAANSALKALTSYARRLVAVSQGSPSLTATIRSKSLALSRAQSRLGHLKGQAQGQAARAQALGLTSTTSPGLQNQIDAATAQVIEAQTQLNGAQAAYTNLAAAQGSERTSISRSLATTATSDRTQVAEIAILLGLLIGGLVGAAAAMALARGLARRP
jgi:capsular polysaccharide biosynthesis protein